MNEEDRRLLRDLLAQQRVLSLGVLVEGLPHVGLLPYALRGDFGSALVHASSLARHSRGMADGAPFSAMIHASDRPDADPLQLPRVTLRGTVSVVPRGTVKYEADRQIYQGRFPQSARTFGLGDFHLYELAFQKGRLVGGFARASTVTAETLRSLAG